MSTNKGHPTTRRKLLQDTLAAGALPMLLPACSTLPSRSLSTNEQLNLTATQALAAMRDGRLSATTYVATLLDRAKKESQLNAVIALNESGALSAAKALDARRASGAVMPPLAGLPMLVKDNIDTVDLPTSGGTPALLGFRPKQNAPVLQTLLDAGVIVLGKANMHELAFGITSTNSATGFVKNPYDPTRIPGGSSGGTAAGIAARIAPAGLGTDTGGSMRIPAALCGIVGMRPSVGNGGGQRRYDGSRVIPISHTRDTIGAMGRTVADVALIDSVISGVTVPSPIKLAGWRIGLPRAYFWENLDVELEGVMNAAVRQLKSAGVVFVEADLKGVGELNAKVGTPVALGEVLQDMAAYLRAEGAIVTVEQIAAQIKSPDVQGAFGAAKTFPRDAYEAAIKIHRPLLQKLYADYFAANNVRAMLFPTTPLPAIAIDAAFSGAVSINGVPQPGGPRAAFATFIRNTDPGSNAGIPGLSLPAGLTRAGLPVGLEVDGPLGADSVLLAIGRAIEGVIGVVPAPPLA